MVLHARETGGDDYYYTLLTSNRLAKQAGYFWPEDSTCLAWLESTGPHLSLTCRSEDRNELEKLSQAISRVMPGKPGS
ncbi:hypothetical protein LguiB_019626 [Lonicera macranthoides]